MDTHSEQAWINLRGARVHNLKNVDLKIPRGKLIAVCGVSGSGKTSLALDTLYAEGQRRYIESFSAYARQFLDRLDKPDFDFISGLPPSLAVTRTAAGHGNRSTVGTASETLDYLRLLYAKVSQVYCHQCNAPLVAHDPQSLSVTISEWPNDLKLMLGFETNWQTVAERAEILADLQAAGFVRLIVKGQMFNLGQDDREKLARLLPRSGSCMVLVDRLKGGTDPSRTFESLETAFEASRDFNAARGRIVILTDQAASASTREEQFAGQSWYRSEYSSSLTCHACELDYPDPSAQLFSFNSPLGACSLCEGFGATIDLDPELILPDKTKSISDGAIACWNSPAYSHNLDELLDVAKNIGLPVDVPVSKLSSKQLRILFEGDSDADYAGINGFFSWLDRKKYKMHVRVFISRWRSAKTCVQCGGLRLSPEALAFRVSSAAADQPINIADLCELTAERALAVLEDLALNEHHRQIAANPLSQACARLRTLNQVGLGYLSLSRTLRTLSGGELQRTALTAALGSTLVNVLYVLDEPSVGLHPHDVASLSQSIMSLTERNNTVLMVEHEEELLLKSDWIIEIGPQAGKAGGEVVFSGPISDLKDSPSLTGKYLFEADSSKTASKSQTKLRRSPKHWLKLSGCNGNNLKNITVEFPLEVLCVVTGISGSGKSSLVRDTLVPALQAQLSEKNGETSSVQTQPLAFKKLVGARKIDNCILVDQSPVSRSPRSNPVTYLKAFSEIRNEFAKTLEARTQNFSAGHFSFNSELGRCERCQGDGALQIDMHFLADVYVTCPDCQGKRYRSDILKVTYRGKSIAEVLELTVNEAIDFFRGSPKIQQRLEVLRSVGLDYLQLGQSATTLSSGEAQRLKLAAHLASTQKQRTLFVLDEPTTGLHTSDIIKLLRCFDALIEKGNSLLLIEHNVTIMRSADHIIDLGPGAAEEGGHIVSSGPPETIRGESASKTAKYL